MTYIQIVLVIRDLLLAAAAAAVTAQYLNIYSMSSFSISCDHRLQLTIAYTPKKYTYVGLL